MISLRTNPVKKVTRVGGARVVGASSNYSPEDHWHDLAEVVFGRRHLAEDVCDNLTQGACLINVSPDAAGGARAAAVQTGVFERERKLSMSASRSPRCMRHARPAPMGFNFCSRTARSIHLKGSPESSSA